MAARMSTTKASMYQHSASGKDCTIVRNERGRELGLSVGVVVVFGAVEPDVDVADVVDVESNPFGAACTSVLLSPIEPFASVITGRRKDDGCAVSEVFCVELVDELSTDTAIWNN